MNMSSPDRVVLGNHIAQRIDESYAAASQEWQQSAPINHFVIDEVLPTEWAGQIGSAFPPGDTMMLRRSLREVKYVAAQMNRYNRLLEEIVYAFQDPRVVSLVERITGLQALEPDSLLYAGGISMMAPGHYLNPHIDNSHDRSRSRYRVLNLLYYVSSGWDEHCGGNLELWPDGPRGRPVTILSRFNRLAVMVTHQRSWHSVSRVTSANNRCCVSNYYFSRCPVGGSDYFHVTSFRGRPEQKFRDFVLRADGWARGRLRTLFPQGAKATRHYYERDRHD
jgi:Rps23 Pro-64 3,4-dihydroxylase Tpa1-like proline 4-hydroxylase